MNAAFRIARSLGACVIVLSSCGCHQRTEPPSNTGLTSLGLPDDTIVRVKEVGYVEEFPRIVQFETVFWEPRDTESLRRLIRETGLVRDKSVLEIGCGTGLVSLCCLQAGASRVVATDINPSAVANTMYNAEQLGLSENLEVRLVTKDHPAAFAVIRPGERYDVIISNPPWEDKSPNTFASRAFFDPQFSLLRSLLTDFEDHLARKGRILLAYGCVEAVKHAQAIANERDLTWKILDDRQLDELEPMFLPGMLLEIKRPD